MKVLKFGGSVLKSSEDIKNIAEIILNKSEENNDNTKIVVVSAFYGITDRLMLLAENFKDKKKCQEIFDNITNFHKDIMVKLGLSVENFDKNYKEIDGILKKIQHILVLINDFNSITMDVIDMLVASGEMLSSRIIFEYIKHLNKDTGVLVSFLKTEDLIKTDDNFGCAKVDFLATNKLLQKAYDGIVSLGNAKGNLRKKTVIICAGFVASDHQGRTTTLGRNGSDYSASIIANALKATALEIWKDIDGLFTADPKIVKNVKFISQINYQEMAELSSLGNKVLHIGAIMPCVHNEIPIFIKNCYKPTIKGTLICKDKYKNYSVNGIIKQDNVVVLGINTNELVDLKSFLIKTYKILSNFEDVIITVSQNFKQKILSILVLNDKVHLLKEALTCEFYNDIKEGNIVMHEDECRSMISVIGSDFAEEAGVAGKIFSLLWKHNISIDSLHDDFSKTRISFLCKTEEANEIVNILHDYLVV